VLNIKTKAGNRYKMGKVIKNNLKKYYRVQKNLITMGYGVLELDMLIKTNN